MPSRRYYVHRQYVSSVYAPDLVQGASLATRATQQGDPRPK